MSEDPPPTFGRPEARPQVRYTPALGRLICERIAAGQSEASLTREAGMPSAPSIHKWREREPEFGAAYEAARAQARRDRLARDREVDEARRWRAALKVRKDGRGGRVSLYTPELGDMICRRVAAAETVLAIGADPQMPCAPTIYHWIRKDAGFREQYLEAKAVAADMLADAALEIALEATEATVRADQLRIATIRWTASMLAPKKYGSRRALAPEEEEAQSIVVVVQEFGQTEQEALEQAGVDPRRFGHEARDIEAERDWWSTP